MWEGTEPPESHISGAPPTSMSFLRFSLFSQLLPKRYDWLGNEHRKSLDEVVSAMEILTPVTVCTRGNVREWWERVREDGV